VIYSVDLHEFQYSVSDRKNHEACIDQETFFIFSTNPERLKRLTHFIVTRSSCLRRSCADQAILGVYTRPAEW